MDNFRVMSFSVLGVGPCQERSILGPRQKCYNAFGVGAIFMILRRVPSRIELLGALRFDVWVLYFS